MRLQFALMRIQASTRNARIYLPITNDVYYASIQCMLGSANDAYMRQERRRAL